MEFLLGFIGGSVAGGFAVYVIMKKPQNAIEAES